MKKLSELAENPSDCEAILRSLTDLVDFKIESKITIEECFPRWVMISGQYDLGSRVSLQIYFNGTVIHRANDSLYGYNPFALIDFIRSLGYDVIP